MEPGRSILEDLERATTPEDETRGFLPQLRWGHYLELMRVENRNERHFYEIEAAKEGWDLPHAPTGGPQFCFQPSLWLRLSSAPASVHADPVGRRFPRLSSTATPRPSTALETVRGSWPGHRTLVG